MAIIARSKKTARNIFIIYHLSFSKAALCAALHSCFFALTGTCSLILALLGIEGVTDGDVETVITASCFLQSVEETAVMSHILYATLEHIADAGTQAQGIVLQPALLYHNCQLCLKRKVLFRSKKKIGLLNVTSVLPVALCGSSNVIVFQNFCPPMVQLGLYTPHVGLAERKMARLRTGSGRLACFSNITPSLLYAIGICVMVLSRRS